MRFIKLTLSVLCLIFTACPPPHYPVLFGYNGRWQKSIKIEEDPIRVNAKGHITSLGLENELFIDVEIAGLDTSKIFYYDTTNFSGDAVRRTHYFDDKVIFESEIFHFSPKWVYIWKNKVDVAAYVTTNFHKSYNDMSRNELLAYLDTLAGSIRIEKIFSQPKLIEVKVDKELLARKLGK
jgi:hypothetical protein